MSRDNYHRHRSRERSRSFSAYRHKQQHHHRALSPAGLQPKHRGDRYNNSPPSRYSRTPERSNGHRNNNNSSPPRTSTRAPEPSKVIGVFGLHVRTPESEIRDIFERFGHIDKLTMIHDVKTRSFRGYCFIYYGSLRDATEAMETTNGMEIRDKRIRVDYSYTQRAHTPTPGIYRGHRGRNRSYERPAFGGSSRGGDRGGGGGGRGHRSRSREDRSHRDFYKERSRDRDHRERRRSPDIGRYRERSPFRARERRRERDRS